MITTTATRNCHKHQPVERFFSSILPSKNKQQPYMYTCSLQKASSALPGTSQTCLNSTAAPGRQGPQGQTMLYWHGQLPVLLLPVPHPVPAHSCQRPVLPCPGLAAAAQVSSAALGHVARGQAELWGVRGAAHHLTPSSQFMETGRQVNEPSGP